jgi:hypothetical protein
MAEAGDICVLLYPEMDERMLLRSEQGALVKVFGGWIVPEPHITIQRFRIVQNQTKDTGSLAVDRFPPIKLNSVIECAQDALSKLAPFPVNASGLTQFLAPFWGTHVLRWEVERDAAWKQLIDTLDTALRSSGCELHYNHEIVPTCSAVDLVRQVKMDEGPQFAFPRHLFNARGVIFTGVLGMNDFETLGAAKIGV